MFPASSVPPGSSILPGKFSGPWPGQGSEANLCPTPRPSIALTSLQAPRTAGSTAICMQFGGAHVYACLTGAGPQPAPPRAQCPASHPPAGLEPAWLPLWPTVWAGTPRPEDTGRAPGMEEHRDKGWRLSSRRCLHTGSKRQIPSQCPRPPPSAQALAGALLWLNPSPRHCYGLSADHRPEPHHTARALPLRPTSGGAQG